MPSATKTGSLSNHKDDDNQNFKKQYAICTMTSFYYYDQNPSGFCFLVLIRAFVIQTSLRLQNLNMKGKSKRILVKVLK